MFEQNNFKFKQLLEQSGLSFGEKYDISNIFNCLSDDRKMDIIDSWPFYLNQILKIRLETEDKRRENIAKALRNIDNIVNEAILRKKAEEEQRRLQRIEDNEIQKNAQVFEEMRRANALQNLIRKNHEYE